MADRFNTDPARPTGTPPIYRTPGTPPPTPPRAAGATGAVDEAKDRGQDMIEQAKEKGLQAADMAKEKGQEAADMAKEKGQQAAEVAGEKLNQGIDQAAGAAQTLADTIRGQAGKLPGDKPTEVAHQAAETIERGAQYLRDNDADAMRGDLESVIRRYPTQSLAVGLAFGFLLARAFR